MKYLNQLALVKKVETAWDFIENDYLQIQYIWFVSTYNGFQIKGYCVLSVLVLLSDLQYWIYYQKAGLGKFLFDSSKK